MAQIRSTLHDNIRSVTASLTSPHIIPPVLLWCAWIILLDHFGGDINLASRYCSDLNSTAPTHPSIQSHNCWKRALFIRKYRRNCRSVKSPMNDDHLCLGRQTLRTAWYRLQLLRQSMGTTCCIINSSSSVISWICWFRWDSCPITTAAEAAIVDVLGVVSIQLDHMPNPNRRIVSRPLLWRSSLRLSLHLLWSVACTQSEDDRIRGGSDRRRGEKRKIVK